MEPKPIKRNVWRSGNSLVVTIGPEICELFGISEGDFVWLKIENVEKAEYIKVSRDSGMRDDIDAKTEKGTRVEIILPHSTSMDGVPSWRAYRLIPISEKIRSFFPGYKVPFEIETDNDVFDAHVSSASKYTFKGDKNAGRYLKGRGLTAWFDNNPELDSGDIIIFEIQEYGKRYKMYVRKQSR